MDMPPSWFVSHDKPIPDGHLDCLERALRWNFDAVWFVEEDVVPPVDTLERLIREWRNGADLAFLNYPMPGGNRCYHTNAAGQVMWTGLGCTLISRQAFEKVKRPWFRTDVSAEWVDESTIRWLNRPAVYGSFDVWFGWSLFQAGGKLKVIPGQAKHIRIAELGERERNNGLHQLVAVGTGLH